MALTPAGGVPISNESLEGGYILAEVGGNTRRVSSGDFTSIANMAASTKLFDGQTVYANGEAFTYDAASMATADGALIVNATGMGVGRLISTRTKFNTVQELMADARPADFFAADTVFTVRNYSYTIGTVPADHPFQTVGGIKLNPVGKFVTPEMFGATGGDAVEDTLAFHRMAWWCSKGYANRIKITNLGTPYLVATGLYSYSPDDEVRASIRAMPGNSASSTALGVSFTDIDRLTIIGKGNPVIKMADSGCTDDNFSWMSLGLLNFNNCTRVNQWGFELDNNRAGQLHSTGARNKTNHGTVIWPNCSGFKISCVFRSTGTLTSDPDKAGDAVYMRNGVKNIDISGCEFYDRGRMDITLERSWNVTDVGEAATARNINIYKNHSEATLKQDGGTSYAFLDIECWSGVDGIYVRDNYLKGQCRVSFGGLPNETPEQFFKNCWVVNNTFDLTGTTNPHDFTYLIYMGGGWANGVLSLADTQRTFVGARIDKNTIISDKSLPNNMIRAMDACFVDLSVSENTVRRTDGYGSKVAAFFDQDDCAFEGDLILNDNNMSGFTYGFYLLTAFHTLTKRTQRPVKINMLRNVATNTSWGIRGALPALPTGSQIVLDDNRFPDQSSRTDFVVSSFVGVSGNRAILKDGNYFSLTGNVFTGFTTPGRGTATILNGNAFVDVPHGLSGVPDFVVISGQTSGTFYVDGSPGGTTFRIRSSVSVGVDTKVSWVAGNKNGS